MIYERQNPSGIIAETIKYLKGCTIQSTISDSAYSDSDEQVDAISDSEEQVDTINYPNELVDAVSNPKRDPSSDEKVATYTTNGNPPQKSLRSRFVPKIIQGAIRSIDHLVTEDAPGIQETLGARQAVLLKEVVTDAARSGARIFRTLRELSRTVRDGSTPRCVNTSVVTTRLTPINPIFNSTSNSPMMNGNQDIVNPRRSIIATEARNAKPLDAPIN